MLATALNACGISRKWRTVAEEEEEKKSGRKEAGRPCLKQMTVGMAILFSNAMSLFSVPLVISVLHACVYDHSLSIGEGNNLNDLCI